MDKIAVCINNREDAQRLKDSIDFWWRMDAYSVEKLMKGYFHYPNTVNYEGFLINTHLYRYKKDGYKLLSLDEFLKCAFNKPSTETYDYLIDVIEKINKLCLKKMIT
jgi:hypothetical protein